MKYLILGLQLFPAILAAVKAVEAHIDLPKAGSEKLALVTGVVDEVYTAATEGMSESYSRESVMRLVMGIVTRTVAVFNRLGIFQPTLS
jgi:hypothetical protein